MANRRRWANDLQESLMDFQSKENTQLVDSLDNSKIEMSKDSLEPNKTTDLTMMLASLNLHQSSCTSGSSIKTSEDSYKSTMLISDSNNSDRVKPNSDSNLLNLSMSEDNKVSKEYSDSAAAQYNHLFSLNGRLTESSDCDTVKFFSCNSESDQYSIRSMESQSKQTEDKRVKVESERDLEENKVVVNNYLLDLLDDTVKMSSSDTSGNNNLEEIQCIEYTTTKTITQKQTYNANGVSEETKCVEFTTEAILQKQPSQLPDADKQLEKMQCIDSAAKMECLQYSKEETEKDNNFNRFFSSPIDFFKNDGEMIGDINQPDIWDALLALDEALSPFDQKNESIHNQSQDPPSVMNRLSQKFKETPTRFTEKLISILEDSIISIESPTKPGARNTSGISLHRMTGEFRKLCKFIEDESMPEISMMNMTSLEKTETPEYEKKNGYETPKNMIKRIMGTPTNKSTPETLRKMIFTPINKHLAKVNSPINRFSPSADKSFEYWEKMCNMMCDYTLSAQKKASTVREVPESTKRSMDEMLDICERQMASLDETIELRSSEPCKKSDSVVKTILANTPRSKSVSKLYLTTKDKDKVLSERKRSHKKVNEKLFFDDKIEPQESVEQKVKNNEIFDNSFNMVDDDFELEDSDKENIDTSVESTRSSKKLSLNKSFNNGSFNGSYIRRSNNKKYKEDDESDKESFEKDFQLLSCSPKEKEIDLDNFSNDDADCSLLIELAKRRQRILDTAKLMMEIDKEDPMPDEDDKCLETLYKLGIQDKTFAEVEEDQQFLNTLGQCLEYRNYFSNKSKPLISMLQNSPEDLKRRTKSIIKSKGSARPPLASVTKKTLAHVPKKANSTSKPITIPKAPSFLRATPKVDRSAVKSTPKVNRSAVKSTPTVNRSAVKSTPTVSRIAVKSTPTVTRSAVKSTPQIEKKTLSVSDIQRVRSTPRLSKKSDVPQVRVTPSVTSRTMPKLTPRVESKVLQPRLQSNKSNSKLSPVTPAKTKITPKSISAVKPTVKTTPRISPTLQTAVKVTPKSPRAKVTPRVTPKVSTLKIMLTPEIMKSPVLQAKRTTPRSPNRTRFFVTPGRSPNLLLGRKKPTSYFADATTTKKATPHRVIKHTFDSVKSPIGLYVNSTDANLIKNINKTTNDRLLTPINNKESGASPKLKFNLASKENTSPAPSCDENFVLPQVQYHSAKKVRVINEKSASSPVFTAPNSVTKKLFEPIENKLVIRHEGRVLDNSISSQSDYLNAETSIRVQKVAEKTTPLRRKIM